jgi:hypothetical protein
MTVPRSDTTASGDTAVPAAGAAIAPVLAPSAQIMPPATTQEATYPPIVTCTPS